MNRASVRAIDAWLYFRASRVIGPAAEAEGRIIEGHDVAFNPRCSLDITCGDYRDAGSRQYALDHD
jgi:hypothetical protein